MSSPVAHDPAVEVIDTIITAVAEVFDPDSSFPPPAGGTQTVNFFAGDEPATDAWNAYAVGADCASPFVWVQVRRRYRTTRLPTPANNPNPCATPRAIAVEVGVGRCAVLGETPTWQQYADEADTSLDDSWRIELALCRAAAALISADYRVTTDDIEPFGPIGGILGWSGIMHVQFN